MLIKFFPAFILFTLIFCSCLGIGYQNLGLNLNYLFNSSGSINKIDFSLNFDQQSYTFLFIVFLVTSIVLLYSEIYIEHYNNKKFLVLILRFFISILILAIRGSYLILMIGWDGLGLTSICLIMFYPNKMTIFNSSLTIFFNRLGDLILIVTICIFVHNPTYFFFIDSRCNFFLILLILICSFTKSAQFPLSSWLPAAISAPTPISAIVHSSTLVTAGIFLINKLMFYVSFYNLRLILCYIRSLTFLLGGLMANLEKDFKKIVAFSTISQIRIIIYFCSLCFLSFSLRHIVFHAFFKTLLFCCTGVFFILKFSEQTNRKFKSNFNINFIGVLFFFSIFRISGLTFSRSFYRKDLFLEIILILKLNYNFFLILLGRFLTILYCSKLINTTKNFFSFSPINLNKNFNFYFLSLFCLISFLIGKWIKITIKIEFWPLVKEFWVFLILFLLILGLLLKLKFNKKIFNLLSMEIFFIKFISYSYFRFLLTNYNLQQISMNDHFFFKPKILPLNSIKTSNFFKLIKSFYITIFLIFLLIFSFNLYSFSLQERDFEAVKDLE